jgi:hypothetical protein
VLVTRRAKAAKALHSHAIVVSFSKPRGNYERQGLLIESEVNEGEAEHGPRSTSTNRRLNHSERKSYANADS